MPFTYVKEDTRVSFELQGSLPIFRERYVSPQVGTVVLKGLFNQTAHIETREGTRYRTLQPKKDKEHPTEIAYPVIHVPPRDEAFRLFSPLKFTDGGSTPRLRFTTTLDNQHYIFKQIRPGQRGFELWDSMEMNKLIQREQGRVLIADATVLVSVPAVLVLLFPWLDNQTMVYQRS
jgi:hypothetical protein